MAERRTTPQRHLRPWRAFAPAIALALVSLPTAAQAQAPLSFYSVTPCRILDTADPNSLTGGQSLHSGSAFSFTPLARCNVSTWAESLSLNVTVAGPTGSGYLSLLPAGANVATSTLNFGANVTRANNVVLKLGEWGRFTAAAAISGNGSLRFIVDVNGYFADATKEGVQTAPPVLDPPPGSYTQAQLVAIRTSTPGAQIRYTTDGSTPTSTLGTLYTQAVVLASNTNLRATAYVGGNESGAAGGAYSFTATPTLLLATMGPQGCATSTLGSGSATLMLAQDLTSATLRFSFSNLTGPLAGTHIHGPNTQVLFDIDTATPAADGSLLWTFAPASIYSVGDIVANLLNGTTYINLHTGACPSGEIKGFFRVINGSTVFTPPPSPPAPGSAGWVIGAPTTHVPTPTEAARFLMQTTFGGNLAEINALTGPCSACASDPLSKYRDWLDAQFAIPATSHVAYTSSRAADNAHMMESFWKQALAGSDQLRQRVAFALSEILVISDEDGDLYGRPDALAAYMDRLDVGAFGNFRNLIGDVARSPAMGAYLDAMSNDREDPSTGRRPDENFAREVLQLFTIGLYRLNPDGSLLLDQNGYPQPTYNQPVVEGFAKVFTGWTLANQDRSEGWRFYWPDTDVRSSWWAPMQQWIDKEPGSATYDQETHHSRSSKTLLDGTVLPPNQTAQQDLDQALDLVFNHPNVGPFLCRGLIQRLVTSNPSPGYIYRCAQAFAGSGGSGRGDMKAVLRAILLDYEARSLEAASSPGFGKLKEPDLRLSSLLRALGFVAPSDGIYRIWNLESSEWAIDQNPLRAPTVFNFFEPNYTLPGTISQAGLYAPEFQIATETTTIASANYLRWSIWDGVYSYETLASLFPRIDWAGLPRPDSPANDALTIDRLRLLLTANAMSKDADADHANDMYSTLQDAAAGMRQTNPTIYWPPIDADCNTVTAGCAALQHLKELVWLVAVSPEGAIQK